MKPLPIKVALVAGATRGAGRGIARALGETGATVYCTGRSVRGHPSPYSRPETIEETAELVTAAGGVGVAVRVDHTVEAEVAALCERIGREQGRLDVLVNAVAGEDPLLAGWKPFWETDLSRAADVLRQTVLSHLITAKYAAPLMIRKRRGLIVEVTEGDCFLGGTGNVLHDLAKCGAKLLAFSMAEALRKHRVAAVAITPGFLRSERMLEHVRVTEKTWQKGGKKDPNFLESETPLFVGRAVAALARDPKVLAHSGELTSSWELARQYGFTDADGRQPDWGKHIETIYPSLGWVREGLERQIGWLERIAGLGRRYLGHKSAAGSDARRKAGRSPTSTPQRRASR
jgi:NAD(P)-dependent dehydrogenase (short-subunit alcohol dehydrogenase family)